MNEANDFNRPDAGRPVGGRYEAFKANVAAQNEYREAYAALRARDPKAAEGVPHPDDAGANFASAMETIRDLTKLWESRKLKADPRQDLRT